MENDVLKIGTILIETSTKKKYRVLYINSEVIVIIEIDTDKLHIFSQHVSLVKEMLLSEEMMAYQDKDEVYDLRNLPPKQLEQYSQKVEWMRRITEEYGPTYLELMGKASKKVIDDIERESSLSRRSVLKMIRIFLQSGCSNTSLLDKRMFRTSLGYGTYKITHKTGHPTSEGNKSGIIIDEKAIEAFEYGINLYKSNRTSTLSHAYDSLIRKYYSHFVFKNGVAMPMQYPEGEYPTKRQFEYYCSKNLSNYDKEVAKTSRMEARNNSRLLLGDTVRYSYGPGDRIQMDEMEADISLQSSVVDGRTIGRPIVYAMIDTYSRLILAVSISLDNNSVIGMTNCFLNLLEDKVAFCNKYGINITPEMWPSTGLPSRILCDRGAEYTSHEATRIFTELGIQKELVSAGTGSLKGCIERWFLQFQGKVNPMLTGSGLITKRHDSNHHKEASLTLEDYICIVLNFVVYHNTSFLSEYPKDKQMIKDGIDAIPAKIWKYGIEKYGAPKPLPNVLQFMYTLMLPVKPYIDRTGINFEGLNYICPKDTQLFRDMSQAGKKRVSIDCRIDPRDVGALYYIRENHLYRAELSDKKAGNASFAGLTLVEWRSIRKYLNNLKREGMISNRQYGNYILSVVEMIVKNAKKTIPSDPSEMKKLREQEKHLIENNNSIFARLESELVSKTGIPMNISDQAGYGSEFLSCDNIENTLVSTIKDSIPYKEPTDEQLKDEQWIRQNIFDY